MNWRRWQLSLGIILVAVPFESGRIIDAIAIGAGAGLVGGAFFPSKERVR